MFTMTRLSIMMFLQFFVWLCWLATVLSIVCLLFCWRYFAASSLRLLR